MAQPTAQQDAVRVDPKHYNVEFENGQVRVLRISYGPGEKSVMHSHPNIVVVFLTDAHVKFTYPDGNSEEIRATAGQVVWMPATAHLPENMSDKPLEVRAVELKS